MAYKYYYIDDDPQETIKETARGLSINNELLTVEPFQHKTWQEELDFIKDNQADFDGLLVDWKLNKKNAQSEEANFNIEALAQQLRIYITQGQLKDLPIVLCSAEYEFKKSFEIESTAQDLFDFVYEKDEFEEKKNAVINQLYSLSDAYYNLIQNKSVDKIIGDTNDIDYRLKDHLERLLNSKHPNHEIIHFVRKSLIEISGLLIDEFTLAARLGIDIDETEGTEWTKLLNIIEECQYKGILQLGWERWWSSNLLNWWRENLECELGDLNAEERVQMLCEKYSLNLSVANKLDKCKSNYYWTICKKTKKPLALNDAILSSQNYEKVPWQEDQYYSIGAALEEPISNIHPLDRDKVNNLKLRFTRSRNE